MRFSSPFSIARTLLLALLPLAATGCSDDDGSSTGPGGDILMEFDVVQLIQDTEARSAIAYGVVNDTRHRISGQMPYLDVVRGATLRTSVDEPTIPFFVDVFDENDDSLFRSFEFEVDAYGRHVVLLLGRRPENGFAELDFVVYEERASPLPAGRSRLRFVNGVLGSDPVDLHLTSADPQALAVEDATYDTEGGLAEFTAATGAGNAIVVTPADTAPGTADLFAATGIDFAPQRTYTLLLVRETSQPDAPLTVVLLDADFGRTEMLTATAESVAPERR